MPAPGQRALHARFGRSPPGRARLNGRRPIGHTRPGNATAGDPRQQLKQLWSRIHQYGIDAEAFRVYLADLGLSNTKQLSPEQLDQCLSEIDARQGDAFQPADAQPAAPATRAALADAIITLQTELKQAEQRGALEQLDAAWLTQLAQWAPVVKDACDSAESTETDLSRYLDDTRQVLSDLRQMLANEAAA